VVANIAQMVKFALLALIRQCLRQLCPQIVDFAPQSLEDQLARSGAVVASSAQAIFGARTALMEIAANSVHGD